MTEPQYICDVHGVLDDDPECPEDTPFWESGDDIFCDLCVHDFLIASGLKPVKVKESTDANR